MELLGHKKTPVRNRGFVPGRWEVVQPLRSRDSKVRQNIETRKQHYRMYQRYRWKIN